jgi:uncharacterized protein DUF6484
MKKQAPTLPAEIDDDGAWAELVQFNMKRNADDAPPSSALISGVVIGTLVGCKSDGVLLVSHPSIDSTNPIDCRTVVHLTSDSVGKQVVLMFEQGDPRRPIVIGCLKDTGSAGSSSPGAIAVKADGETVTITAQRQIVLQCGKASLTLTKSGKLIMRGEYISQRSVGVVRIKGGCVEIN